MITYTTNWVNASKRYEKAVERAIFLSEEEKFNWKVLTSHLSEVELIQAEKLIINEDLRRLNVREKLHKIKPQKK